MSICKYFSVLPIIFLYLLTSCTTTNPAGQQNISAEPTLIIGKEALKTEIEKLLSTPELAASNVGIKIIQPKDGSVLYKKNAEKLFHPASTVKLFTSLAALIHLGADYRFTTKILTKPHSRDKNIIKGDLFIVGSGDPSLTSSDLTNLAEQIFSQGLTHIKGNIVCDASLFDSINYGKGWMWDDQPYKDFAPISALSVNKNTVEFFVKPGEKVDSPPVIRMNPANAQIQIINLANTLPPNNSINISASADKQTVEKSTPEVQNPLSLLRRWQTQENIVDVLGNIDLNSEEKIFSRNIVEPAIFLGTLFKDELENSGIKFDGQVEMGKSPESAVQLANKESASLNEIITSMNKESHNLDAELILKALAAHVKKTQGTAETGIEIIRESLAELGMDSSLFNLADGSGVSRYNLLSPTALTDLLRLAYKMPIYHTFKNSLPIAGVDGTLKERFQSISTGKKINAKTGSMKGVSVLAGYIESEPADTIAFAIFIEHFIGPSAFSNEIQDRICSLLSYFQVKDAK